MQSTSHIAAVMTAADLPHLPPFVQACLDRGVGLLTVYTAPASLRLAPFKAAGRLLDALGDALAALPPVDVSLAGRLFYVPADVQDAAGAASAPASELRLRIALDYASSLKDLHELSKPVPDLAFWPESFEPGNLLRWQFAGAYSLPVRWQTFSSALTSPVAVVQ